MEIRLEHIGKKYGRSWIFRKVNLSFFSGEKYAILGSNGSGKSTLLQLISGYQTPTEGNIWYQNEKKIKPEQFYRHIALATPYIELPEELTLIELLHFHSRFKSTSFSILEIMQRIELEKEKDKEIRYFSSGMRQRVRLGMSLLFEAEAVLLDEPTTHLDAKAIAWYQELLESSTKRKCLIISSNQEEEYRLCPQHIHIEEFKQ
jgi:ABC-type multidrug transport system ATPase subunit